MKLMHIFSRIMAKVRFKTFRLMSILLLGREGGGSIIGQCVSNDLEFANAEAVRNRILVRKLLSEVAVQNYSLEKIPTCWEAMFSRIAVFPRRYAYILRDVIIGPESGVIFAPPTKFLKGDGIIFIPSVCHPYFFFQSGIQEVMRTSTANDGSMPICPMPVIGYYHEMFEGLIRVFISRKVFGDIYVLVPANRPKYIDEMLELIGIDDDRIVASDCPVRVKKGILIPRWSDCGENLKEDVREFRDFLVSRLPGDCNGAKKLYISRARSRRALPNEIEIEGILAARGFRIAYFEELPFAEQLTAIRAADIVVSPHGAGLSNLIVARPGTKVVEIMTQAWANSCYGHLASSLGLDYTCIDADNAHLIEQICSISSSHYSEKTS